MAKPMMVNPTSCGECGSVDLVETELELAFGEPARPAFLCKDCESHIFPRKVLDAAEVYNRCAEYYAMGLDIGQLEAKRKILKAEVEQALQDWGAGKFEADGFKAGPRAGRKLVNHKQMAIDQMGAEKVTALEPAYTKEGQPYFQIDGPKV